MKTIFIYLFSFLFASTVFAGVDSFKFNCKDYDGNDIVSGKFDVNEVILQKGILAENFGRKTEEAKVQFKDVKGVNGKYKNESKLMGAPLADFDSTEGHPLTVWPYSFSDADADFWAGTELRFEKFYTNVEEWKHDEAGKFQKTDLVKVLLPSEINGYEILHGRLSEYYDGGLDEDPTKLLCKITRIVE